MVKAEWKKEEGRERENGQVEIGEAGGKDQGRKVRHAATQQRGDSINWIRDINERTATRAETWGMWRVGSMWQWVREHRRTPKGWDSGGGRDSGGMGAGQDWDHCRRGNLRMLGEGGCRRQGSSGQCWRRE